MLFKGSIQVLPRDLFTRESLYFSVSINDGEEPLPRRSLGKVPRSFRGADVPWTLFPYICWTCSG